MLKQSTRSLPLLAVLVATLAQAAPLGPSNPPPGVTVKSWREATGRAQWVTDSIKEIAPGSKVRCIYAVALDILGRIDIEWSMDASGRGPGTRRAVAKGQEDAYSKRLKENADSECKNDGDGDGGLQVTVRGLLAWAADQNEWTTYGYQELRANVIRAAQGLAALGPAAGGALERALVLPSTVTLPILNPELFMPRREPKPGDMN